MTKRKPVQRRIARQGIVYVLSHPEMPGLLKIGYTTRSVSERMTELSAATGVPGNFVLELKYTASDAFNLEKRIHISLTEWRLAGTEFFRCDLSFLINRVYRLIGILPDDMSSKPEPTPPVNSEPDTSRLRFVQQLAEVSTPLKNSSTKSECYIVECCKCGGYNSRSQPLKTGDNFRCEHCRSFVMPHFSGE